MSQTEVKLHEIRPLMRTQRLTHPFQMDDLENDASEVLLLVRFLKNSLAPINRIPVEVLSLIPEYCDEGYADQVLITLTHVCHSWRDVLISCSSLWTTLDLVNVEKTRTYIERSKASPLRIHLYEDRDDGANYLYDAFSLVIPHIPRLKSLVIDADVFPDILEHFRCHVPFLERLSVDIAARYLDRDSRLFDGDLPSLRELALRGVGVRLPWNNMANLRVLELAACPPGNDVTRLLDLFESSPLLQRVELLGSIPKSSNAPPERIVPLPHLTNLGIHADRPHSILLNHLRVPTGASVSQWFYFGGTKSPLLDYLPAPSTNLMNISHTTTVKLRFDSKEKFVKLSGPSGNLNVFAHWNDRETIPSYVMDRRILRSLNASIFSTVRELSISEYMHPNPTDVNKCPVFQTLSSTENLRTLVLTRCNVKPFILALNPGKDLSKLVLCPNLEELVLRVKSRDQLYIKRPIRMAENQASRGTRLSSITITSPGEIVTEKEVLRLRRFVIRVEIRADDASNAWDDRQQW